jgi:arylsulfatase
MNKHYLRASPVCRTQLAAISAKLIALLVVATLLCACDSKDANTPKPQLSKPLQQQAGQPNIILLLLDDAGYSDMSAFGGEIETPNIERIVRGGMTVRRFYTTARCSPTRAGILTGYHPHDVGMADLSGSKFKTAFNAYQGRLPTAIPMVSELLQEAGYRTYLQGKWHLGDVEGPRSGMASNAAPNLRGFDHFIGFLAAQAAPYPSVWSHSYQHNQESIDIDAGWFSISGLNEETVTQLSFQFEDEADIPFFLYIASQSPHYPLGAPEALIEKYRKIYAQPLEDLWNDRVSRMRDLGLFPKAAPVNVPGFAAIKANEIREKAVLRAAMIEATDTEFGKLLTLLEKHGKLDNTLIVVASDNGAAAETSQLTNAPYRGAKGNLYEGGVLSPLAAQWPAGGILPGAVADEMSTYLDLMPTFLAVAGVTYPENWQDDKPLQPLMGRNLLPIFRGETLPSPEFFYWNLYGEFAVLHDGRWKLMGNSPYNEKSERNGVEPTLKLYDLLSDPAETRNVAPREKAMTSQLYNEYKAWAEEHGAVPFYQVLDAYRVIRGTTSTSIKDN